jgi:hypothetical protein
VAVGVGVAVQDDENPSPAVDDEGLPVVLRRRRQAEDATLGFLGASQKMQFSDFSATRYS